MGTSLCYSLRRAEHDPVCVDGVAAAQELSKDSTPTIRRQDPRHVSPPSLRALNEAKDKQRVPIYSLSSLISLYSLELAFFLDTIRDCYEAFVI